jgi:hypothetical protein
MIDDLPELGIQPTMSRFDETAFPEVSRRMVRYMQPQIAAWASKFVGRRFALTPARSVTVQSATLLDPYLPWKRLFEIGLTPQVTLA